MLEWLKDMYHRVRYGGLEWEFCPGGWTRKDGKVKGWNVGAIAQTQKLKWPEFMMATKGTSPLTIAHEAPSPREDDYHAHHLVMAYAYVLALAAHKKERLSLLDWGGGIGHYCILSRRLLPEFDLEYYCKDVPVICKVGREVLPEAQFIERDEDISIRHYDLVLASGSLQYIQEWKSVARLLASVANPYLFITRLPIVWQNKSFVVHQRAYAYGYGTEYMSWFLNRGEFLDHMVSNDCELIREFAFHNHSMVNHAPEQAQVRGFLFRKQSCVTS